jgi:hypothetical protein
MLCMASQSAAEIFFGDFPGAACSLICTLPQAVMVCPFRALDWLLRRRGKLSTKRFAF